MTIRLTFHGAARTVTGSCYAIETGGARILVDCGMFQGSKTLKALNYEPFPFAVKDLDAVLLTHAHIDHSGLLPKLFKAGYAGPIHATDATIDLLGCMLPDSGHIQEMEVEQLNRREQRRHKPVVEPIYTAAEAQASLSLLRPVNPQQWFEAAPGIRARYWNAGHMLGSASIEVECRSPGNGEAPRRLLFSGDVGPREKLLQPPPESTAGFDYVVCESTYGDRVRDSITADQRREKLLAVVKAARERGGPLIIPSFAVERTQELITDLALLVRVGDMPPAPTFIDSPLAQRVTGVFEKHAAALDHAADLLAALHSPWLRFAETVEDSKAIGRFAGFHIVIAASGMCDAGRIRHHLRQWLWHGDASVLLVGFQAQGTLGRLLQDGVGTVRIQGEEIRVAATIATLDDYSGHADGAELQAWLAARGPIRRGVFLVHGEEPGIAGLRARIVPGLLADARVIAPGLDDAFELDGERAQPLAMPVRARLAPQAPSGLDWHNDLSELTIAIHDRLDQAADAKAKGVVLRRLRRALAED